MQSASLPAPGPNPAPYFIGGALCVAVALLFGLAIAAGAAVPHRPMSHAPITVAGDDAPRPAAAAAERVPTAEPEPEPGPAADQAVANAAAAIAVTEPPAVAPTPARVPPPRVDLFAQFGPRPARDRRQGRRQASPGGGCYIGPNGRQVCPNQ